MVESNNWNGKTSSSKQVLVGRRERTSLKAPAGEAIYIPQAYGPRDVYGLLPRSSVINSYYLVGTANYNEILRTCALRYNREVIRYVQL